MNIIHPPFVHFIIALPFVALFSQFTYLITKDTAYSKAALRIIGLAMLVSLFAIFSGIADAQKAIESHNVLQGALSAIQNHRNIGFVVVGLLVATTAAKWFALSKRSPMLEILSLVLIILTLMTSLYQGRSGGALVYQYATGIDKHVIQQRADALK